MLNLPILSLTIFLPIISAILILFIKENQDSVNNIKLTALCSSIGTFILSFFLWLFYKNSFPNYQFVEKYKWFQDFNFYYHIGIDGISLYFVLLTTFLTPLCILISWDSIKFRVKEYMIAFLFLETLLIGMFSSIDTLLFYIFFEGVLIPMFLIIGIWGGKNRIYAAFKFFLYTLLGSVLLLVAVIYIYLKTNTMNIQELQNYDFNFYIQIWLWLAFFASFAIKIPMWPFHTWLPDAHVEAPTAGSVILAGVLLKMGGYGFIRFSLSIFPEASHFFSPLIFALSVIAIIYTSFVALAQTDWKKLIAYSSVAHMGIVTVGIFIANQNSIEGAMIQMLSHGIVSAALFICIGVVYDRTKTREIHSYGGLVNRMPLYSSFFMIFTLASVGLPGTSGFVGEFLVILGTFKYNITLTFFVATGIILSVIYMLYLYKRIIFGEITNDKLNELTDLNLREKIIMILLILLILIMGIYPNLFLDPMRQPIEQIISNYNIANAN
ncbi:MAG: NADH-quinone oxidoreductase subunit M [Alphaproteobacteria bacterium MarineAlpha5_Bin9]|nr:MAG: NADH-quinone oxidoreductase subunit M [Alphaproteobacteria bacterium MarineAlpha5_Bin9]|tara:strand:+ start:2983 stop:4467 length:1485 start_codon:yes stop_codon:yes gene_type:complete